MHARTFLTSATKKIHSQCRVLIGVMLIPQTTPVWLQAEVLLKRDPDYTGGTSQEAQATRF